MKTTTLTGTIGLLFLVITASILGTLAAERLVPSQYATIQAAVDAAASGDTIRIAAGEYRDQAMVLNKRLSIVGDPGAVLHAHPEMRTVPWNQNVAVFGFERADVVVSNLVLEGNLQADYFPDRFFGIIFRSSSGRLENCTIRGFRGTTDFQTRAVNVNNGLDNGIVNISVGGCSFSDNYLSLALYGSDNNPTALSTRFTVQSNVFTGLGATAPFRHVGIWIAVGAEGSVTGNTIIDHTYASENSAAGINANDGLFEGRGYFQGLRPVVYSGNIFSNNTIHLTAFAATGTKVTNNVFARTAPDSDWSALGLSGSNLLIAHNNFADMPEAIGLWGRGDTILNVPRGIARNTKVTGNWFTNVANVIRTNELVTFEESGTEICCFQPSFLSMTSRPIDGSVAFSVRAWHGQPTVLESSSDLRQWAPVLTNSFPLPISELEKSVPNSPRQFYRLRDLH